jgi:sterol desaturase/sphingolipid hydroxylase (fatty acid hydroxylase superfamily)
MFHISKLTLLGIGVFIIRVIVLTSLERRQPAHQVRYREVFARDLAALTVFGLAVTPGAELINRWFAIRPTFPAPLMQLPLALRFFFYVVIADFGYYWVHRLMHTALLWRVHKWHHSPNYMYWLVGVRGSLLQQTLVNTPYIFAEALLDFPSRWLTLLILVKNTAQNDWMHLNVRWGARWLEWLIVTPRYHHIHHSDNPEHYRANLAALFPIWDRLFGTYVDPETVNGKLTFGIGERVPVVRLAVGV